MPHECFFGQDSFARAEGGEGILAKYPGRARSRGRVVHMVLQFLAGPTSVALCRVKKRTRAERCRPAAWTFSIFSSQLRHPQVRRREGKDPERMHLRRMVLATSSCWNLSQLSVVFSFFLSRRFDARPSDARRRGDDAELSGLRVVLSSRRSRLHRVVARLKSRILRLFSSRGFKFDTSTSTSTPTSTQFDTHTYTRLHPTRLPTLRPPTTTQLSTPRPSTPRVRIAMICNNRHENLHASRLARGMLCRGSPSVSSLLKSLFALQVDQSALQVARGPLIVSLNACSA
ncbi:hypothetical protein B0H12DRAFT_1145965 [Mycena haematopus]|nr:hypothetical protein B0H12DRAFT_1145965 [Mycena haematopus]